MAWALLVSATAAALVVLVWRLTSDERLAGAEEARTALAEPWSLARASWVFTAGFWMLLVAVGHLGPVFLLVGVAVALWRASRA